jgi:hypothetical protein
VNVDPELRKRVEQIKSSPVQLYREAGDYSNRELVEGILVSPDDIAAIEAVARASLDVDILAEALNNTVGTSGWLRSRPSIPVEEWLVNAERIADEYARVEAAHHRMVQPDHYQRWER